MSHLTIYDSETLATLCAAVLQDRCAVNKPHERAHRSKYHSSRIPAIPLTDYVRRIAKYSRCSAESLLIAVIYLDRYVAATHIPICFTNAHRLVIVAVLVAAKIRDDIYYSNAYYGSIGGVHLAELNDLEADFVQTLNWTTFVRPEEYGLYLEEVVRRGAHLLPTTVAAAPPVAPAKKAETPITSAAGSGSQRSWGALAGASASVES